MALMLACCLFFAGMGACYRVAMLEGLPVPLVPFARGLFTVLVMLPWALKAGPQALATRRPGAHAFRCAAGLAGFLIHMLAILWMPLADAVAILHARPLWALPLAFLLLGERIGWDRAIAAAVGFAGVIVIAVPQGAFQTAPSPGLIAALAGLKLRPVYGVLLAAAVTVFCTLVFSVALGLPFRRFGPWLPVMGG